MFDVLTIEIIGIGFGFLGTIIAIYSLSKQRKLESKIKEKEKFKELSKKIEINIIPWINRIIEEIENPLSNEDIFYELQMLSQLIISKAFDEKIDIIKVPMEIRIHKEEESNKTENKEYFLLAENKEDVIKCLEEGHCSLFIGCTFGDGIYYAINDLLSSMKFFLSELEKIDTEFGYISDEFKPNLIKNLKFYFRSKYSLLIDSAINSLPLEVNVKTFTRTNDIGLWIYKNFNGIDEIKSNLDELIELKSELENLRETLIITSYT